MTTRDFRRALLVGVGALGCWAATHTDAQAAAAAPMRVQGIRATESDGDTTVVIAASARPTFTTFKLEKPARVVIDLSGARLGDLEVPFDAGTYTVGSVSASSNEDESGARTRVVLTLRHPADCRFETRGNEILVRVVPQTRPAPAASPLVEAPRPDARAAADAQARKQAAEKARAAADSERQKLATERATVEEARKQAQAERAQADEARKQAEAASRKLAAERAEVEVQKVRTAQAAHGDAERMRRELEQIKHEAEKARTASTAAEEERDKARREKESLEAARADMDRRQQAVSRSEVELHRAQQQTQAVRQRAEAAERQAEVARLKEEERGNAVEVAAAQIEARRRMVESKLASQEAQRQRLAEAERLVSDRDAKVQAAAAELTRRVKAASEAAARQAALEEAGATDEQRARAARDTEEAAQQRKVAQAASERSRHELADAVGARKQEEARRRLIEAERLAEERRLEKAVAARATEEARRQAAEDGRHKEEARLAEVAAGRARAEAERAKVQADRDALVAEVKKLKERTADKIASKPVAAAEPAPAGPHSVTLRVPSRVQRIDFVDEPTRSSVIIDLDEPSLFAVQTSGGRRVTLRLLHADLPRGLERSLDATEYLGPVKVISSYRDPESPRAVRVDVDLAEDVPNKVRQDGSRLYWDFQKAALNMAPAGARAIARSLPRITVVTAPKVAGFRMVMPFLAQAAAPAAGDFRPGGPSRKRYTGRRVDLDFKSADIHNILRLLADVGQVNIFTSDDVRGEVTVKMHDVPWDQALDVVLRAKGLGSVREGNLIRVAPLVVLEKELEQEIARQRQIQDVLPVETRLIGVSYADAKVLQDRAKDLLSTRGKISVDDRTNNLIVSDVAKNLALIEELVRNLDTQTSQVVIEARIVEARSTFTRQLGVQWGGTGFADVDHGNATGLAFPYNVGVGGGATDTQTPTNGLVPAPRNGLAAANPNFAVNLPVAAGTGAGGALGLTLGSVAGAFNINLRLSALESTGQVRILSSPRVTTLDNIEATIEQGVAIPISVVSAAGVNTVFVDARLALEVKPHVTNEGTVMMNIHVTRNEPDFVNTGARGDPTILKKEAKTSMLIRDGDTAVIGGIYTRNSGLSYAKVPFFADIPVLGVLFRNRRENDDRTEFLVFITPRIANRGRALAQ